MSLRVVTSGLIRSNIPLKPNRIFDTSARDGIQANEKDIPTETKIQFINYLSESGLKDLEVASISKLKQMRDGEIVYKGIIKKEGVRYWTLVGTPGGFHKAYGWGCRHFGLMASASNQFSIDNTEMANKEAINTRQLPVLELAAKMNAFVRVYPSCMFGYKKAGDVSEEEGVEICKKFAPLAYQIVLSDTTNFATVEKVDSLIRKLFKSGISPDQLAVHFHGTGEGVMNKLRKAHDLGIRVFDTSIKGLGGCPAAKEALGIDLNNAPTEDVAEWLKIGINYNAIKEAKDLISPFLDKKRNEN